MSNVTTEQAAANVELIVALAKGEITHREALGVSSEQMISMAEMGQRLLEKGSYDDAREVFDGLVALDPNVAYFHQGLGTAYFHLGNKKEAGVCFRQSMDLDPEDTTAHVNMAMICIEEGNKEEAKKLLEEAKRQDPKERQPMAQMMKRLWAAHFA